jgi:hypothetical protein
MKLLFEEWRKYKTNVLTEASFNRFKRMIDEQRRPFLVISAYRKGEANQTPDKNLKSDIKAAGYPFIRAKGAGQEEVTDPETGEILKDPKTGDDVIQQVIEMTHIVTTHKRGDVEREMSDLAQEEIRLFELGKSLSRTYDQYAFIFGRPEIRVSTSGKEREAYFIAAYNHEAPTFDEEYRLKEPWAGPWTTIERATEDDVFWTKIAGTKGKFVENKIRELKKMKINNRLEGIWRDSEIQRWKSLL